jgi:DNA-binding CsgD family transcriptional regulator
VWFTILFGNHTMSIPQRLLLLLQAITPTPPAAPSALPLDADLLAALQRQADAENRLLPDLIDELLRIALAERVTAVAHLQQWQTLTGREQQVAALTCLGQTNAEIAACLVISPNTVRTHMRNVLYKLQLNSKTELQQMLIGWDFHAWLSDQDLGGAFPPPPASGSSAQRKPADEP